MIKNNKKLIVNYVPNTEKGIVTIYPKEYFCPKDYTSGTIIITDNTYAIHHFDGSWCYKSKEEKTKLKFKSVEVVKDLIKK